jgi:hypothetical protein
MDGNVLTQITSIKASWNSGQNRVDLLVEGLAGFTPGSGDVTVDLGYAVPIGGLEEDYTGKLATGTYVKMQLFLGSKDYVGTGKIMTTDISQSVNAGVEGTLQWIGELKALQ